MESALLPTCVMEHHFKINPHNHALVNLIKTLIAQDEYDKNILIVTPPMANYKIKNSQKPKSRIKVLKLRFDINVRHFITFINSEWSHNLDSVV